MVKYTRKFGDVFEFAAFTLPAVIVILIFVEIPFIMSCIYSFTKWNGLDKSPQFIGFKNYIELFADDKGMLEALTFTFFFTIAMVVCINVVSLLLAIILDSDIKGKNLLRAIFYIPNIISLIVIGFIWRFIYSRVFDTLYEITHAGIFQLSWLGEEKLAFISVVIVSVWQAVGFYIVIYIAGLQTVPQEVIEASYIDGAGRVKRFFNVTLPMIMPSVTICVFYSITNALKTFDVVFSLTDGGPGNATTSIALDIYRTAFNDNRFGYGSAKSVVLFVIVLAVTIIQLRLFKSKEVEL